MATHNGATLRVYRQGSGWHVMVLSSGARSLPSARRSIRYMQFEDMPILLQERLAVLRLSPVGVRVDGVGKHVSDDMYWVFVSPEPDDLELHVTFF